MDGAGDFQLRADRTQQYDLARTLSTKIMSSWISRMIGREFFIFNSNYQFTEFSAFKYVVNIGKDAFSQIMMCENGGDQKWCCRCTKCAQLVLYSLALKHNQKEIDASSFLENSRWMDAALQGDGSWYKGLTYPGHFDGFRYVLSIIDGGQLFLSKKAKRNLLRLIDIYKKSDIIEEDGVFVKNLFASWPSIYAKKVYRTLENHFPFYEAPQFQKTWGNNTVYRAEEFQAVNRSVQLINSILWKSSDH